MTKCTLCSKIGIDNMMTVHKLSEGEMKVKRSLLLMLSFVLIIGIALAACSSEPANDDPDKEGSNNNGETGKDPVELRIVTFFGGTDPATEVLNEALEKFMAENDHVTIVNESLTSGDGAFRTKVQTEFATGNEPDLTAFFVGTDARDMIDEGLVVPMDDILAADPEWAGNISEAALEQVRAHDGNIYAIPITGYYEGIIANKELFDQYNLELPTDWEKLNTAIETFSENGVVPLAASLEESYYLIEKYILAAGGQEANEAGLEDGIHDAWIKGLELIKEHYEMNAFPKDAMTIDDVAARELVDQGRAAMMINGSWAVGGLSDEMQENVVVLPMPIPPGGAGTYGDVVAGFGSGFYISTKAYEDAQKQEAVVKLLKFLTSNEVNQQIAEANSGVPANNVQISGLSAGALSGHQMIQEATSVSYPIDSQISTEAFTHIRTHVPHIVAGRKSAEEVLKEAQQLELNQ